MVLRKFTIDRVYCYALNSDAVDKLKSDPITSNIPIISAHTLTNTKSKDFFKNVQVYYRSRLPPIDSDHAYDIYRLGVTCNPKMIHEVVESGVQIVLGIKNRFYYDQNSWLPKGMTSMNLDVSNIDSNTTTLSPKVKDLLDIIEYDFPYFRLKIVCEKAGMRFSLMGCFPIRKLTGRDVKRDGACDICGNSGCYTQLIRSNLPRRQHWKLLCPLCIENYVERSILNKISGYITKVLALKQLPFSMQRFDPIERNI